MSDLAWEKNQWRCHGVDRCRRPQCLQDTVETGEQDRADLDLGGENSL